MGEEKREEIKPFEKERKIRTKDRLEIMKTRKEQERRKWEREDKEEIRFTSGKISFMERHEFLICV